MSFWSGTGRRRRTPHMRRSSCRSRSRDRPAPAAPATDRRGRGRVSRIRRQDFRPRCRHRRSAAVTVPGRRPTQAPASSLRVPPGIGARAPTGNRCWSPCIGPRRRAPGTSRRGCRALPAPSHRRETRRFRPASGSAYIRARGSRVADIDRHVDHPRNARARADRLDLEIHLGTRPRRAQGVKRRATRPAAASSRNAWTCGCRACAGGRRRSSLGGHVCPGVPGPVGRASYFSGDARWQATLRPTGTSASPARPSCRCRSPPGSGCESGTRWADRPGSGCRPAATPPPRSSRPPGPAAAPRAAAPACTGAPAGRTPRRGCRPRPAARGT